MWQQWWKDYKKIISALFPVCMKLESDYWYFEDNQAY